MPARYVRPYSKGQNNDFRDAEAIAEAVLRPTMKFVAIKTVEQLDLQGLHRVRERLVRRAPRDQPDPRLPARARHCGAPPGAAGAAHRDAQCSRHDGQAVAPHDPHDRGPFRTGAISILIATVSNEIETVSEQDDGAKRLMTVPGIGPIISTATVAAIGSGDVFSKGRDFGAWLGLVPRQMSTGGRTVLGPISKRGNRFADAVRPGSPCRPPAPTELEEAWPQILDSRLQLAGSIGSS